jgi:hypothetical protein
MMQPDMWNKTPDNAMLAVDNACFNNPSKYSDARYEAYLAKMPLDRTLFATAPDVLGNHAQTVERSVPMLKRLRELGFNAAFVAQDGWDEKTTPWQEFDVLFVGGSTEFKFRGGRDAVAEAKKRGKQAHMGRVNSLDRLRASIGIGCDSADGTCLRFGPDKNWPHLLYWLEHTTNQPEMAV